MGGVRPGHRMARAVRPSTGSWQRVPGRFRAKLAPTEAATRSGLPEETLFCTSLPAVARSASTLGANCGAKAKNSGVLRCIGDSDSFYSATKRILAKDAFGPPDLAL